MSPRQSGIATVYQDLALAPLMSVWRNFFLGNEIRKGLGLDIDEMKRVAGEELTKMGIVIPDLDRAVSALSGGQRQVIAIARAIYFGANVVILDEPTAALGVKQSGVVLKYILKMRDAGLGVIFITHNPHHAYLVGNHFIILKLGRVVLDAHRSELTLEQLTGEMAGGQELEELSHELAGADPGKVVPPAPEGEHAGGPAHHRRGGTGGAPRGGARGGAVDRRTCGRPRHRSRTEEPQRTRRPLGLSTWRPSSAGGRSACGRLVNAERSTGGPQPGSTSSCGRWV